MKIEQRVFEGMIPRLARHLLPETKAAIAKNTKLYSGNILPFKGLVQSYVTGSGINTIYQYRDDSGNFWFEFQNDVNVVESPIADDPNNRVYMSGTTQGLRWTDNLKGVSAAPYPTNTMTLVFDPPNDTPNLTLGTEPPDADPTTAEDRSYVYTYVTDDGWESSPSPLASISDVNVGQDVTVTIVSDPGTVDLNITKTRLYRTTPAGTWQFVKEQNIGVTSITDDIPTDQLGEVLVTTTWLPASNALKGLIVLDQGAFCAFKKNELWFSEPYIPYGWPLEYRLSTMNDIVAIKAGAQSIYIATEKNPYVAFGTAPGEYQLVKIDEDLPCVSKRSMVDAGERAFYASTGGIVMFEGQTAQLVTTDLIHKDQWWADFDPANITAVWFDHKMFCFTPTTSFIFDPKAADIVELDITVSAVYNSLEENLLYVLVGNKINKWDSDSNSFLAYEYHSRDSIYSPNFFSAAKVNAESYDSLTFKLFRDGQEVYSTPVTSNVPFRLPTTLGRKYSWSLIGTDEVRGVFVSSTTSELYGL